MAGGNCRRHPVGEIRPSFVLCGAHCNVVMGSCGTRKARGFFGAGPQASCESLGTKPRRSNGRAHLTEYMIVEVPCERALFCIAGAELNSAQGSPVDSRCRNGSVGCLRWEALRADAFTQTCLPGCACSQCTSPPRVFPRSGSPWSVKTPSEILGKGLTPWGFFAPCVQLTRRAGLFNPSSPIAQS